jgi:hypothetical protein
LENCRKNFPIVGKIGQNFPTIGKKFSNHWKNGVLPMSQRIGQNPAGKPIVNRLSNPRQKSQTRPIGPPLPPGLCYMSRIP